MNKSTDAYNVVFDYSPAFISHEETDTVVVSDYILSYRWAAVLDDHDA